MNGHRLLIWVELFVLLVIVAACQAATDNTPIVPTPAEKETSTRQEAGEVQTPVTATPTATAGATPVATEARVAPTPSAGASADDEALPALQAARDDLARRLEEEPEAVEVIKVEEVRWPDASLGCPLPGAEYEQKTTTGYVMVVEANGERYEYHTDATSRVVLCEKPAFPIVPSGDVDETEVEARLAELALVIEEAARQGYDVRSAQLFLDTAQSYMRMENPAQAAFYLELAEQAFEEARLAAKTPAPPVRTPQSTSVPQPEGRDN